MGGRFSFSPGRQKWSYATDVIQFLASHFLIWTPVVFISELTSHLLWLNTQLFQRHICFHHVYQKGLFQNYEIQNSKIEPRGGGGERSGWRWFWNIVKSKNWKKILRPIFFHNNGEWNETWIREKRIGKRNRYRFFGMQYYFKRSPFSTYFIWNRKRQYDWK